MAILVTWKQQSKEKKYPPQLTYRTPVTQELRKGKAYLIGRAREYKRVARMS
jgi:hypothetical protein